MTTTTPSDIPADLWHSFILPHLFWGADGTYSDVLSLWGSSKFFMDTVNGYVADKNLWMGHRAKMTLRNPNALQYGDLGMNECHKSAGISDGVVVVMVAGVRPTH